MPRPLSAAQVQAVIDAAVLEKAPDHRDTRRWHVVSNSQLLAVIEPAYRGLTRHGWRWKLAGGTWAARPEANREKAAVVALGAWQRWATSSEEK
ncbi:hypothetical protein [Streptomyces sp. KL116D]|uniref:hypothetical protein n=1 Tax=Streptomyces sp. KL116D TaxID=3045152 RepID=UPI0035582BCA